MKITFEMDNLQDLIEKSVSGNIEEAVKSQVEDTIKEQVAKLGGDIISEVMTKNFNEFVNDYITNTKITVRKEDFWGDADVNEYTVEEYIKKCLKERLDNEKFKTKDKYGHTNEISFSEYIKNNYTSYMDDEIKKKMDKYFDDIRKQINKTMKETFDNTTKNMLSNTVLNILTQNNTYRQIESNIKSIATKQD
jgi:L-lactate utilization protein LutC